MKPRLLHSLLTITALCASASAQTTRPTTQPTTQPTVNQLRIEQLINELAADTWQSRQTAQDTLVQYGPDIRPRLSALLRETKDEEVRTRVEAALRQIEENRTPGASLITLQMKGASPKEVFAEISRQAS